MTEIPLGKLKFNEDVEFVFPTGLCCNCGVKAGLRLVEQDTRRTSYMVGGGTEITFKLPLPFCEECAPSAARRPKNVVHRLMVFVGSFGASALALIVLGDLVFESPAMAKYLVPISLLLAAFVTGTWIAASRPRGAQTSYYQRVRIPVLMREFISGVVTGIGFAFTNRDYARAFGGANGKAVMQGVVSITRA